MFSFYSMLLFVPLAMLIVAFIWWLHNNMSEGPIVLGGMGIVALVVGGALFGGLWSNQARDLGTYRAEQVVINVYQSQIDQLTQELQNFHYQSGTILNADSPVASVVQALSHAQEQKTHAEAIRAQAEVKIEQTRLSIVGGVIWWVGDYK
jgi:multidrug resistance efflux pump